MTFSDKDQKMIDKFKAFFADVLCDAAGDRAALKRLALSMFVTIEGFAADFLDLKTDTLYAELRNRAKQAVYTNESDTPNEGSLSDLVDALEAVVRCYKHVDPKLRNETVASIHFTLAEKYLGDRLGWTMEQRTGFYCYLREEHEKAMKEYVAHTKAVTTAN